MDTTMRSVLVMLAVVLVASAAVDTSQDPLFPPKENKTEKEVKVDQYFQQPLDEIPKEPTTAAPPQEETIQEETILEQQSIPVSEPDPSPQLCFDGQQSPILIGLPGHSGPMGPQGVPGYQGPSGVPGSHGVNGVNGLPGYPGNRGQKGAKGDLGTAGVNGAPGYEGPIGPRGNQGYPGEQGLEGQKGQIGRTGSTGSPGATGTDGPPGIPGRNGERGAPGLPGEKGDCLCPETKSETSSKRNKISFSVGRTSGLFADNGPVIMKWNHVFNEAGGSFNPETGVFNCSVAGSYYFAFHIAKSSNTNFPLVSLMKNGEPMAAAIDYGSMDSEDSTSNSLILDLEINDQVWLELYEGREVYSSHYKYTTFSGWLLFPAN